MVNNPLLIFSGTANPALTESVCRYLKSVQGEAKIWRFPDGEKIIRLESDVRGRTVLIQPTNTPVDQNLMELLIFSRLLKRASARRVTACARTSATPARTARRRARADSRPSGGQPDRHGGGRPLLSVDLHASSSRLLISPSHLTAERCWRATSQKRLETHGRGAGLGNMKLASRYRGAGADLAIIHKARLSGEEVPPAGLSRGQGPQIVMCDT